MAASRLCFPTVADNNENVQSEEKIFLSCPVFHLGVKRLALSLRELLAHPLHTLDHHHREGHIFVGKYWLKNIGTPGHLPGKEILRYSFYNNFVLTVLLCLLERNKYDSAGKQLVDNPILLARS